jgi:inner membrane protein involved in colicin E2 resistance
MQRDNNAQGVAMAIFDHSRSVGAKAFVVGVIVLLLIPLTMLRGLVTER